MADSEVMDIDMAIQLLKYWTIYILVGKWLHPWAPRLPPPTPLPYTTFAQALQISSTQQLSLSQQG